MSKIVLNKNGGYQFTNAWDKKRAEKADLITYPDNVLGANCMNCQFVKRMGDGSLYCSHEKVSLPVTPSMCCALWKNPGQVNSWE